MEGGILWLKQVAEQGAEQRGGGATKKNPVLKTKQKEAKARSGHSKSLPLQKSSKITEIDRSKFSTFAKTLPLHIKDMINIDISKAIVGTSRKLGGYIDVNFNRLGTYEAQQVKSYLLKLGYEYQENGATKTAISYKHNYKGK